MSLDEKIAKCQSSPDLSQIHNRPGLHNEFPFLVSIRHGCEAGFIASSGEMAANIWDEASVLGAYIPKTQILERDR